MLTDRLAKLRKDRDETQADVAKHLGIERTTYGKYETGGIQPPIEVVLKLAEYYGVTTDYLLGNDKTPGGGSLSSGHISGSAVVNGKNTGTVTVTNGESRVLSKEEQEILRIYSLLDVKSRIKLLECVLKIEEDFSKGPA